MNLLLLAMACVAPSPGSQDGRVDPDDTGVDTGGLPEEAVLSPTATAIPGMDGLVWVRWEAGTAGESWVEYGLDGVLDQRTPSHAEALPTHEVVLLGLKLGWEYDYRACTLTPEGELLRSEVGRIHVPPPPPDLIPAHLQIKAAQAHQGFVIVPLITPKQAWITILDADGDYVWLWRSEAGVTIPAIALHPSGHGLVWSQQNIEHEVDAGEVVELSLDGSVEEVRTRTYQGHHAFARLPDGSFGRLSLEQQELTLTSAPQLVSGDRLIEVARGNEDPGAYDVVFDFFADHAVPPGPEVLDEPEWVGGADWTHANSLVYLPPEAEAGEAPDPMDGHYYLGARNLDAVYKIHRPTGEVQWELGGPHSDFPFAPGAGFSHGHFSELWEGGLLMLDNRLPEEPSRVVEYAWDEQIHRVEAVWEHAPADGDWISFLGDARRLPSDHVLVSWSSQGTLEEVDRSGEVLWQVQLDLGGSWGRVLWVPDLYDPLGTGS